MRLRILVMATILSGALAASAWAQVRELRPGGVVEGALPGQTEVSIPLVRGKAYRFQLSSDAFDPMLELLSPAGAKLAEDDDGGGGLNAQILHVATADGVYRLRVLANQLGSRDGPYTLLAVETEAPRPPEATPLTLGQPVTGTLGGDGDPGFRVYAVNLRANQILTATMEAVTDDEAGASKSRRPRSGLDPLLELRPANAGPTQSPLARDDDGGEGLAARLTFTAREAGDYHLYARGSGAGRFALTASATTANPKQVTDLIPGRTERQQLTAATASAPVDGGGDAGLFHAWRLRGRAGQTVTLDLRSDAFDPVIEVLGDTSLGRTIIARDDDGGEGRNAQLTIRFVRDEVVDVRARSLDGKEGEYQISVSTPGSTER
jgi:hypothetical protein